jgi:ubiquinone/menaquinone biosynthesis C-methylase UbiE
MSGHDVALSIFPGLAKDYERSVDLATLLQDRYWKKWLVGQAAVRQGDRVLDIGCGTMLLEEKGLRRDCSVVGLDITTQMLRLGKAKDLGNVGGVLRGDAEFIPFMDSTFDVVVSCYVAKYVDVGRFIGEAARVVHKGGRVVLYDFVRPKGGLRVPLMAYVHGGIGGAGVILRMARSESAETFQRLPGIVEEARWDRTIEGLAARAGLRTSSLTRMTGGIVSGYAGVKVGREGSQSPPLQVSNVGNHGSH